MVVAHQEPFDSSLRERLQGLMAIRVIVVTLLLGSAIAIDLSAFATLDERKNLAFLSLIVGTYALTIGYAIALTRTADLDPLAGMQVVIDFILVVVLVSLTGGLDSLFIFLFYLTIISAAVVVGRRSAFVLAGVTSACLILLAADALGFVWMSASPALSSPPLGGLVYTVAINASAAFLVAALAGNLSARLGRIAGELERQQFNVEELRALNRDILASLNSGLLTVDPQQRIIFFNRAAEELSGIRAEDAYGQPLRAIFPDSLTQLLDHPRRSLTPRLEMPFVRPDGGEVFLGFSVSVLRDSRSLDAGRIVIFQDLSDVKRLEADKKRAERMAAIGELAAAIAHEIRNPLASISGSVEMLASSVETDDIERSLMQIVVREVDRLDHLITNFLDYSRPRPLARQDTDLFTLIDDVITLFGQSADTPPVRLEAPTDASPFIAYIDRESVQQAIWNLLNNAADALVSIDAPQILVELRRRDGRIVIAVEDNGTGVPPDDRQRIFEPFFTTRAAGTGLGLATLHRIMDEHAGLVRCVDPHRLSGARFELEFSTIATAHPVRDTLTPL